MKENASVTILPLYQGWVWNEVNQHHVQVLYFFPKTYLTVYRRGLCIFVNTLYLHTSKGGVWGGGATDRKKV